MIHLCLGLRNGRPCPRTVKVALGLCPVCRPAQKRAPAPRQSQAAYLRGWRARRAQAGTIPDV